MKIVDPGLEMVKSFHEAFGCHVSERPAFPEDLKPGDKQLLQSYAYELADAGRRLKASAALANSNGRIGLGLLLIRLQLLVEEVAELADAMASTDLTEALDALTDIGYVLNGTYLTLGLGDLKLAADVCVHASNMSKLDEKGRPIIDASGRVVKGPEYEEPKKKLAALVASITQQETA